MINGNYGYLYLLREIGRFEIFKVNIDIKLSSSLIIIDIKTIWTWKWLIF